MTTEQIIKKAIAKAIKNGWTDFEDYWEASGYVEARNYKSHHWVRVIFSHNFAQAFWGEARSVGELCGKEVNPETRKCCNDWDCKETLWLSGWQTHLQEMVLETDPISYLARFL